MVGFADFAAQMQGKPNVGGPMPGPPMSPQGPGSAGMGPSPMGGQPPISSDMLAQAIPGLQLAKSIIDMILASAMGEGPSPQGPMPPPEPTNISPQDMALLAGVPPGNSRGRPNMPGPSMGPPAPIRPVILSNPPRTPGT